MLMVLVPVSSTQMDVMVFHAFPSYAKVLDGRLAEAIAEGVQEDCKNCEDYNVHYEVRYVLPVDITLGCHLPPSSTIDIGRLRKALSDFQGLLSQSLDFVFLANISAKAWSECGVLHARGPTHPSHRQDCSVLHSTHPLSWHTRPAE